MPKPSSSMWPLKKNVGKGRIDMDRDVEELKDRFGPARETAMGDLLQLRQRGSLAEYNDEFDTISCMLVFLKSIWLTLISLVVRILIIEGQSNYSN